MDGSLEICLGAHLMTFGFFLFIWSAGGMHGFLTPVGGFIASLALGVLILYFIKTRVTYPRTGRLKYRRQRGFRQRGWDFFVSLLQTTLVLMAIFWVSKKWWPAIFGANAAIALISSCPKFLRFYFLAAASVLVGLALSLTRLEPFFAISVCCGLLSFVFLLSGGFALRAYLRRTQPPGKIPNE
jgi:hypothetical protein